MKINPSKTDLLDVKSKRPHFDETFQIRCGFQYIRPSTSVKVHGVVLDSCLNWESQISATARRCYGILVGLAKLSHRLPRGTKKVNIQVFCVSVAWAAVHHMWARAGSRAGAARPQSRLLCRSARFCVCHLRINVSNQTGRHDACGGGGNFTFAGRHDDS